MPGRGQIPRARRAHPHGRRGGGAGPAREIAGPTLASVEGLRRRTKRDRPTRYAASPVRLPLPQSLPSQRRLPRIAAVRSDAESGPGPSRRDKWQVKCVLIEIPGIRPKNRIEPGANVCEDPLIRARRRDGGLSTVLPAANLADRRIGFLDRKASEASGASTLRPGPHRLAAQVTALSRP